MRSVVLPPTSSFILAVASARWTMLCITGPASRDVAWRPLVEFPQKELCDENQRRTNVNTCAFGFK
jgi:hypothetical protein